MTRVQKSLTGHNFAADQDSAGNNVLVTTSGGVLDSAGGPINPDNYAQVLTYNADNTVNTIAFTDGVSTWTQTFTHTAGNVTNVSKWVKTP